MIPGAAGIQGAPFWSPDCRALAFPSENTLKHLDLPSRTVRTIAKLPKVNLFSMSRIGGTWAANGVILIGLGGTIYRVPAGGGAAVAMTFEGLPAGGAPRFPMFLPDGRRFLFLWGTGGPDLSAVYLASLDGGPPQRLFAAESQAAYAEPGPGKGHLLFIRDGNLVAQPFDAVTPRPSGDAFIAASQVPLDTAEFLGLGRGRIPLVAPRARDESPADGRAGTAVCAANVTSRIVLPCVTRRRTVPLRRGARATGCAQVPRGAGLGRQQAMTSVSAARTALPHAARFGGRR